MPFAVELYMGDPAATAVRQLWQSLVQEGIRSQPLALGARPHISLCVYESLDSPLVANQLEILARQFEPFSFVLESVDTFPASNGVVFLAPRLSEGLIEAHRRFHKEFDGYRATASPYYLPKNWQPHCTVAEDLSSKQVSHAIEVCRKTHLPIRGQLVQIGLIEFRPIKEVCLFALGKG
jgi:2'-5' RNA ligase